MKSGIGYTIVTGDQFALISSPGDKRVDNRRWGMDDEAGVIAAAKAKAAQRKLAYLGFMR